MEYLKNVMFATEQVEPMLHLFGWYHILIFLAAFAVFHYMNHTQKINKYTEFLVRASTIFGYIAVTYFQWWASNKTIKYMEEKKNRIKINNLIEVDSYDSK